MRKHQSAAFLFAKDTLKTFTGGGGLRKTEKRELAGVYSHCKLPLLEFSSLGKFPVLLQSSPAARHPYRTFCKSVSAAFHNADASHGLGEGPVIVNERTFKDVVFRTRITVDLESMMPSRFVYYQQLDGRTRPLIELTSEHEEFAGIYLPIRIGFRTVEFLSPGKELDAFGSLKIRWRTVNERIYLPSANDLSSQDKLMEFLGETTN